MPSLSGASSSAPVTGKRIAALRVEMGLSVPEFAQRIGVSVQAVYSWEKKRGRLHLRSRTQAALNKVLWQ